MRIGLHGRNDVQWPGADLDVLATAKIETLKMMSHTDPAVFKRIRARFPDMEFIVRLYDDRIGNGHFVSATEFTTRMLPIIESLRPWVDKFEIHNEPNHETGLEGWGSSDEHAKSFSEWYRLVLAQLRMYAPWARYGFPGLAPMHRDMYWLNICADAIRESDWLGVHCYWQFENHLSDVWGMRYLKYHAKFPTVPIEVTEFGDSSPDLTDEQMARRITQWYLEAMLQPYIRSGSAFILSSQDPQWAPFAWRLEDGRVRPVVQAVGEMPRETPLPKIHDISASLPRVPANSPTGRIPTRNLSQVQQIVIHHTVTPAIYSAQRIARYHVYTRKFPTIGYTFIVQGNGIIQQTNPLNTACWHISGQNTKSLGVALTGAFMGTTMPTTPQLESTSALVCYLYDLLGREVTVLGHKEAALPGYGTSCPGSTWHAWRSRVWCP